jgi:hypothetical protein
VTAVRRGLAVSRPYHHGASPRRKLRLQCNVAALIVQLTSVWTPTIRTGLVTTVDAKAKRGS